MRSRDLESAILYYSSSCCHRNGSSLVWSSPQAARRRCSRLIPNLRWVVEEQLHLTLSFLGDVDTLAEDRLREALDQVRVPPFFLPLCGVGVFNVRGQPSVVWAGVGKGHPHLFLLHRAFRMRPFMPGSNPILNPFTRM
jgi:RNA 2',3'-cyclic 3'-phosphodiesterase